MEYGLTAEDARDIALEALKDRPLEDVMNSSLDFMLQQDPNKFDQKYLHRLRGIAYAMSKGVCYLAELQKVVQRIEASQAKIADLQAELQIVDTAPTYPVDLDKLRNVVKLRTAVFFENEMLEMYWHQFAINVNYMRRLLPMAMKNTGQALNASNILFLQSYVDARDHFEHLYEKLPGMEHEELSVIETDEYLIIALERTADGSPIVKGTSIAFNRAACKIVHNIYKRANDAIFNKFVSRVTKMIEDEPELSFELLKALMKPRKNLRYSIVLA